MYLLHRRSRLGLSTSIAALTVATALATVPTTLLAVPPSGEASITAAPALPVIPKRDFALTNYHPVGDPASANGADATQALKDAVAAVAKAGGGRLIVPPGKFRTLPAQLTSNLELHLQKGATLTFTTNPADYELPNKKNRQCLEAADCHDIAITGEGRIDGQGADWWPRYRKTYVLPPGSPPLLHRPYMVVFSRCTRVLLENVTLANSPSFHLVPAQSRDVTIRNITISAPKDAPNTDGIDPSGWNYLIIGCTIDVGDDNIALKPVGKIEADKPSCRNFRIENCTFRHGHGMSIGGQTPGGLDGLVVRDCTFEDTDAGIRMKAARGSGGLSQNMHYERLTMKRVKVPVYITSYYPRLPDNPESDPAQPVNELTPIWRHITIKDVTITDSPEAGRIIGLPEMPVEDITFTNVKISAARGMKVMRAKDIRFVGSGITAEKGPSLVATDAQIDGLAASAGSGSTPRQ